MLKPYVALTNLLAASRREDGQTMAEYGVVLAVIAVGIIVALGFLSGAIEAAFERVTDILEEETA